MSLDVLAKVVNTAVQDTRYRSRLLKDPKGTLIDLKLTREEYSAILQLNSESFSFMQENIDPKANFSSVMSCIVQSALHEFDGRTLSRFSLTDLAKLTDGKS